VEKEGSEQQYDYIGMFNALVVIAVDRKAPHQIVELALLCIYLITIRISIFKEIFLVLLTPE